MKSGWRDLLALILSCLFLVIVPKADSQCELSPSCQTILPVKRSGTVLSPGYPSRYPSEPRGCVTIISVPKECRILLTFIDFALENDNTCAYDSLSIRDGDRETKPDLGTFCGEKIMKPFTSGGSKLYLKFCTDDAVSDRGYKATYRAIACAGPCESNPCRNSGTCGSGSGGAFKCSCPPEWKGKYCHKDVDECASGKHNCIHPATCKNKEGSYRCRCKASGYKLSPGGFQCADVDECASGEHDCIEPSQCENTVGSFKCVCPSGFRPADDSCLDVNECSIAQHVCRRPAKCKNTPGSFRCVCTGKHQHLTPDGHGCECDEGFLLSDSGNCLDIDECEDATLSNCMHNCTNFPGSFNCSCKEGYTVNQTFSNLCDDVNECELEEDPCSESETCINTNGSFFCSKVCFPPEEPHPYSLEPEKPFYVAGSSVKFSCGNKCYGGPYNVECLQKGEWRLPLPTCDSRNRSCLCCGRKRESVSSRIIQGQKTSPGDWPWQALVRARVRKKTSDCGGVLIHPEWVLTAAHCMCPSWGYCFRAGDLRVYLGLYGKNVFYRQCPEVQRKNVVEVVLHPLWFRWSPLKIPFDYDFALLKLDSPVYCCNYVIPICLNDEAQRENKFIAEERKCVVTGWGKTDQKSKTTPTDGPGFVGESLKSARRLLKARVPLVGHEECRRAFRAHNDTAVRLSDSMICAGFDLKKETDTGTSVADVCHGDSGGPLVCWANDRWYVVGVVSFGHKDKCGLTYSVYARVSVVIDWIRVKVPELVCRP